MYAKVIDGAVIAYPYSISDLKADYPTTSFPSAPTDEQLADYGMVPVQTSTIPTYDPMTERIVDELPVLDGVQWVEAFSVAPLAAEVIAELAKQKADADDVDSLKATTFMSDMLSMSADDFENKIKANSSSLAALTAEFTALAKVVQVIAKMTIR